MQDLAFMRMRLNAICKIPDQLNDMSSDKKAVFVVYGRNDKIKSSMFTFLRSLGLKPLEWEQARQLTDKATPTTLEIVKAGIDHSQAVVVLFTGDDVAKLRKTFGDEPQAFQPRPNVIFEAGWAMAVAGQERTIFISFPPLRGMTDIDGINSVHLDNSAETRNAVVQRLRTTGCDIDDSGSDYLSVNRGGDFAPSDIRLEENLETYSELLDRGKFTEFLADGSLSLSANSIKLNKALFSDLRNASYIDLKYHYLGPFCASNWIDLCQHPDYGHDELKRMISESIDEFIMPIKQRLESEKLPLDIVSLGSGDGSIDALLLYKLGHLGVKIGYYYCVDISFDLLQHAVASICQFKWIDDNTRIKAIHGDFTDLSRLSPIYTFDNSVNLFVLTGYTIGNFNEGQLIHTIRQGMQKRDLLLVDARLHSLDTWDGTRELTEKEQEQLIKVHAYSLNDNFALGPIEITAELQEKANIKYEVNRRVTVVPKAMNVVFYCENFKARMRGTSQVINRDRLDLACTSMYSFESLSRWFPNRGFDVLWSKNNSVTGLFLLSPQR